MAEYKNIGGAWKKTTKNGETYLSMSLDIEGLRQVAKQAEADGYRNVVLRVFQNKFKKQDNHPDFTIPFPQPKQQNRDAFAETPAKAADSFEDDIPF